MKKRLLYVLILLFVIPVKSPSIQEINFKLDNVERNDSLILKKLNKPQGNGVVLDSVVYHLSNGNKSKSIFTHRDNGKFLAEVEQDWDLTLEQWANYKQINHTYNDSGQINTLLQWDTTLEQWMNDWCETHTYDSSGNMLKRLRKDWDLTSGHWVRYQIRPFCSIKISAYHDYFYWTN
jgi:hypothetical protein